MKLRLALFLSVLFLSQAALNAQFGYRTLTKELPQEAFVKMTYRAMNDSIVEGFGFPTPTSNKSVVFTKTYPQEDETTDWELVKVKYAEFYYNGIALYMPPGKLKLKYRTDKKFLTDTLRVQSVRNLKPAIRAYAPGLSRIVYSNEKISFYDGIRWIGYSSKNDLVFVQFNKPSDPYERDTYMLYYHKEKAFIRTAKKLFADCPELLKRIESGEFFPKSKSSMKKLADAYAELCQ